MGLKEGIRLYHGSYMPVETPDLTKCNPFRDFGRGFYLTTDINQAKRFVKHAIKKALSEKQICGPVTEGYVSVYFLSGASGIKEHFFEEADRDWLHCVVAHRKRGLMEEVVKKWADYDIIGGKIANDYTNFVITNYLDNTYGPVPSAKADEFAIRMLEPDKLKNQICFRSEVALRLLRYRETRPIRI